LRSSRYRHPPPNTRSSRRWVPVVSQEGSRRVVFGLGGTIAMGEAGRGGAVAVRRATGRRGARGRPDGCRGRGGGFRRLPGRFAGSADLAELSTAIGTWLAGGAAARRRGYKDE